MLDKLLRTQDRFWLSNPLTLSSFFSLYLNKSLLILATFFADRSYDQINHEATSDQILQLRYARGEIDAATFDQMRERVEASEPRER